MGSNVLTLMSIATSNYNALNVKVQNQMSHGLEFLANYSWQKNLQADGDGPASINQTGTSIVLNTYNLRASYSVSDINIAQTLTGSAAYQLPVGSGQRFLNSQRSGQRRPRRMGRQWHSLDSNRLPIGCSHQCASSDSLPHSMLPVVFPGVREGAFESQRRCLLQSRCVHGSCNHDNGNGRHETCMAPAGRTLSPVRRPRTSIRRSSRISTSRIRSAVYLQFRSRHSTPPTRRRSTLPAASDATLTCKGNPGALCNSGNSAFGALVNGTATGRQIQFAGKLYF